MKILYFIFNYLCFKTFSNNTCRNNCKNKCAYINNINFNEINPMFKEYVSEFKLIFNDKIIKYSEKDGVKIL